MWGHNGEWPLILAFPKRFSTHTGQNVPHLASGFSCLSGKEVSDPFDTVLKVPSFMLLGILVTVMINDMFERRDGFFPPGQPLPGLTWGSPTAG